MYVDKEYDGKFNIFYVFHLVTIMQFEYFLKDEFCHITKCILVLVYQSFESIPDYKKCAIVFLRKINPTGLIF